MKRNGIFFVIGVLLVLLVLFFIKKGAKDVKNIETENLKPKEETATIVDTARKSITTIRRSKNASNSTGVTVGSVKGVRKARIATFPDGHVEVSASNRGFTFEPGFSIGCSAYPYLALDVQWAYWKEWGVLTGINTNINQEARKIRPFIAVNRDLNFSFFENTSVYLGVDSQKDVLLGLRVRF